MKVLSIREIGGVQMKLINLLLIEDPKAPTVWIQSLNK